MSRIRSVKPEWLEDELALASLEARVLSVGLILMADDYGNGRAHPTLLASRVFPANPRETLANALEELRRLRYVTLYEVEGQQYFSIRNWSKHQRVDKPGKAIIPGPPSDDTKRKPGKRKVPLLLDKNPENFPECPENPTEETANVTGILAPDWKGEERKGEREAAGAATRPTKRWKRIPADWVPRPEDGEQHALRGVDLKLEEEKIRDWEFKDWRTDAHATWRTWLRRASPTLPVSGTMRTATVLDDDAAGGWS